MFYSVSIARGKTKKWPSTPLSSFGATRHEDQGAPQGCRCRMCSSFGSGFTLGDPTVLVSMCPLSMVSMFRQPGPPTTMLRTCHCKKKCQRFGRSGLPRPGVSVSILEGIVVLETCWRLAWKTYGLRLLLAPKNSCHLPTPAHSRYPFWFLEAFVSMWLTSFDKVDQVDKWSTA